MNTRIYLQAFFLSLGVWVPCAAMAQQAKEEVILVQPNHSEQASLTASISRAKPVHEGATIFERVSRHEMTRLQVVGGRIRHINFKPEELEITQNHEGGQAILTPLVDKEISLFVTTNSGVTFTLILRPEPGLPARTVAVTEQASEHTQSPAQRGAGFEQKPTPLSMMTFEQAITTLIYVAANNQQLQGVSEQTINTRVPLWQGTEFVHLRNLKAAGMVLSEFRLTNTSKQPMRLIEQELYKPGVLAVAVEQHALEPGESTPVLVVLTE